MDVNWDFEASRGPYLSIAGSDKEILDFSSSRATRALGFSRANVLSDASPITPEQWEAQLADTIPQDFRHVSYAESRAAVYRQIAKHFAPKNGEPVALVNVDLSDVPDAFPSARIWTDGSLASFLHSVNPKVVVVSPFALEGLQGALGAQELRTLSNWCETQSAVLLVDETDTGWGATGDWWSWEDSPLRPEAFVFGNRVPMWGFASQRYEVTNFPAPPDQLSRASAILSRLVDERVCDVGRTLGEYFRRLLTEFSEQFPFEIVGSTGVVALLAFADGVQRDATVQASFEEHLLVDPRGTRRLSLTPPLDISGDGIGRGAAQFEVALRRVFS